MGELLAFLVALVNIAQPLRSLVGVAGPINRVSPRARAFSSCSINRWSNMAASTVQGQVAGVIEFDGVSFNYAGKNGTLEHRDSR